MTPEAQASALVLRDFSRALRVLTSRPKTSWCQCKHHESAHPLQRNGDRPCQGLPVCACPDFLEAPETPRAGTPYPELCHPKDPVCND